MKSAYLLVGALAVSGITAWVVMAEGTQDPVAAPPAPPAPGAPLVMVTQPATLSPQATMGKTAFDAVCAACHGDSGAGRNGMGPPLIHKIYEPSHHGDESFQRAVAQGVRAHHWTFGNMPAVEGLTRSDVGAIVAYVRALQRANGIN